MAIVKNLPGFEVTIVANGQPLTEYVDNSKPDQDSKTIRYIEAISDQVFEIRITAKKGATFEGDGLMADTYTDGAFACAGATPKGVNVDHDYIGVQKGVQTSLDSIREFCFSSLESGRAVIPIILVKRLINSI